MQREQSVVLTCRLQLVITEYEVIGYEGECDWGCLIRPTPGPSDTGISRRFHA
jgi:hypothetical protein